MSSEMDYQEEAKAEVKCETCQKMFNPLNHKHVAKHRLCGTGESGLSRGRPPTYANPT